MVSQEHLINQHDWQDLHVNNSEVLRMFVYHYLEKIFQAFSLTTVHVLVENGTGFHFLESDYKYEWCVMPN